MTPFRASAAAATATATILFAPAVAWAAPAVTRPVAAPAPAPGWAYVWANQSSAAAYTPARERNRTSAGRANTVRRLSVGRYLLTLPGLGQVGGVAHVTAQGTSARFCTVGGWVPAGPDLRVAVNCFDRTGASSDAVFSASFVRAAGPGGHFAYLWADRPTSGSYTPATAFQFNSTGGNATVRRAGTGVYQVSLPGLGTPGGHVQVTAFNPMAARCGAGPWHQVRSAQVIPVRCVTAAGRPLDTRFSLTYARGTSLLRLARGAYAWSSQPSALVSVPALPYQYNAIGGVNTVRRLAAGIYRVEAFGQPLANGNVQVTAYGAAGGQHCEVTLWSPTAGIQVRCFTAAGSLTDAAFGVSFAY